jgi:hypothetical protein
LEAGAMVCRYGRISLMTSDDRRRGFIRDASRVVRAEGWRIWRRHD